jgi:hypothetical protein
MEQNIKEHLEKYALSKGWKTDEETLVEIVRESDTIWCSEPDSHRWWDIHTFVSEIDGMFIGFEDARSTGDTSTSDLGYEFDPETIKQYYPKEITTIIYTPNP